MPKKDKSQLEFEFEKDLCPECKGSGLPTRKHSDLDTKCGDCKGTGKRNERSNTK